MNAFVTIIINKKKKLKKWKEFNTLALNLKEVKQVKIERLEGKMVLIWNREHKEMKQMILFIVKILLQIVRKDHVTWSLIIHKKFIIQKKQLINHIISHQQIDVRLYLNERWPFHARHIAWKINTKSKEFTLKNFIF